MSVPPATRRTLVPLVIVTAAGLLFTLLLLLVRLRWAPLESADHGAAAGLNSLIAGHPVAVSIVKAVTWLGSGGVLWTLVGAAAVVLAVRRRWRLTAYLPVAVALARTYRGEHHPTDILASALFAALWLTATTTLIKPNGGGLDSGGRRPLGLPHRKAADHSRETASAAR